MTMWIIILVVIIALAVLSLIYVGSGVCRFGCIERMTGNSGKRRFLTGAGIVLSLFAAAALWLNLMNAVVVAMYFAMFWMICDFIFFIIRKIIGKKYEHYYAGWCAVVLSAASLSAGWYCAHHVWETDYRIETGKITGPLRVVMFADSHIGSTFNAEGFAGHLGTMESLNPDVVIVAGDYVDDDSSRDDMIESTRILGKMKSKYGVYFVLGNHDKGYYGPERRGYTGRELLAELEKNGIKVLQDESVLIDDRFYIIGRRDYSVKRELNGSRKSMDELVKNLDRDMYMIVADHQPADYENQASSGVDLVLSGHTHGGQLIPFNPVGKWIGANDRVYGHEKRGNTDFIVTSGLSDWTIKFKTGTKSEFVVIDINR